MDHDSNIIDNDYLLQANDLVPVIQQLHIDVAGGNNPPLHDQQVKLNEYRKRVTPSLVAYPSRSPNIDPIYPNIDPIYPSRSPNIDPIYPSRSPITKEFNPYM